jgi:hypothetical protein
MMLSDIEGNLSKFPFRGFGSRSDFVATGRKLCVCEIDIIADCTTEGSSFPMRQISLHRLIGFCASFSPQVPARYL